MNLGRVLNEEIMKISRLEIFCSKIPIIGLLGSFMNILIVEDEAGITRFLNKGLTEEGFLTSCATNGVEALEIVESKGTAHFDIAIVDYMMPIMDGRALVKELRQRKILLPIIMLTAKDEVKDKIDLLELGCDDYLTKPFSFGELVARIKAIAKRSERKPKADDLHTETIQFKDLLIDLKSYKVFNKNEELNLTKTEIELLTYLIKNRDRVVSRTQILENVRGYSFDPNTNIVDVHIKSLRKKVGNFDLIKTVRGVGYMIES